MRRTLDLNLDQLSSPHGSPIPLAAISLYACPFLLEYLLMEDDAANRERRRDLPFACLPSTIWLRGAPYRARGR